MSCPWQYSNPGWSSLQPRQYTEYGKVKAKVKLTQEQATKAQKGRRCIALLCVQSRRQMGWVVNDTLRPLHPLERPGTHCIGGWVGTRTGLDGCGKSRPHWDSIPGLPSPQRVAILSALYRPTDCDIPAHTLCKTVIKISALERIVKFTEKQIMKQQQYSLILERKFFQIDWCCITNFEKRIKVLSTQIIVFRVVTLCSLVDACKLPRETQCLLLQAWPQIWRQDVHCQH